MAAIITNKFRVQNARSFMNSSDNYYMFIGRPQPWDDEISPDTPVDNVDNESAIWDDMMSLKKITSSNISHGVIKRNWVSGKYYDIYRNDYGKVGVNGVNIDTGDAASPVVTNLSDANYYVVTTNGNIYICLDNKGTNSTESPDNGTIDGNYIVTCSDGYIWRKIAVTSGSDIVSFATPQYYPVKTLTSDPGGANVYYTQWLAQQQASLDGGMITNIILVNGGSGFTPSQTGASFITIEGDGTGATATVNTNGSGVITAINITNRGYGYTWATATFTGGTGAAATVISAPIKGLGADPVADLCAFNTIVNARFEYSESGTFTTNNDYRRIGLLVNPLIAGSSSLYTDVTAEASTLLKVTMSSGAFQTDDIIKVQGAGDQPYARVIDVTEGTGGDAGLHLIRIIRTREENSLATAAANVEFDVADTIQTVTGSGNGVASISSIVTPDIEPGSGSIVYIENRRQVTRSPDQVESITTVFEW